MAESTRAGAGEGCGAELAAPHGCSPSTPVLGSRGRRGGGSSPADAAHCCREVGASRTPGPSSAHRSNLGNPPAARQGPLCPQNAARERSRVQALRRAFLSLQAALPTVPPGTKLSKLDVLVLATSYIAHLSHTLDRGPPPPTPSRPPCGHPLLHPLKKWPMRSRLYTSPWGGPDPDPPGAASASSSQEFRGQGDKRLAAGDGPP